MARLQSDFVAAVSHEFPSPLTSICQIAQMLATDRIPSEVTRQGSYDVLVTEAERLLELVEGLLDFGRFDRGAEFKFERLNVTELVQVTVSEFAQRVARVGYAVEFSGTTGCVFVEADREALSRALWNLLDNAAKYSVDCRTIWVEMESDATRSREGDGLRARGRRPRYEALQPARAPRAHQGAPAWCGRRRGGGVQVR